MGPLALLVAVGGLLAAGCSGGVGSLSFPNPPSTTVPPPAPQDSLPPGLASISEAPVAGVTTTTAPAIGPGNESINGTVTGPNGPVAGATVEIDRFVGSSYASARTTTAADGTWSFRRILGGDYRVRAWQAPNLDMDTPTVVFLGGQPQSVALQLQSYPSQQVQVAINPGVPTVDQPADLVVQVTSPRVSADGVLSEPPVVGVPVTLVNGPAWQVQNGNPLPTDPGGQATFQLQCTSPGTDPLSAQVANNPPVALQMPACLPPPPPSTTTSTTLPGGFSGTTSTTCPPPPAGPGQTTTTLDFGQQC